MDIQVDKNINEIKIRDYLLNSNHEYNKGKANYFHNALGFNTKNYKIMLDQLEWKKCTLANNGSFEQIVWEPRKPGVKVTGFIKIKGSNNQIKRLKLIWLINQEGIANIITILPGNK